ncbi:hypothetical protein ACFPIJ_22240 [Dactylosporangium cerinum]|uniref:Uncharacterized protein n=1 Tax=Dactylosporangium cerinum TaxID=1434730 RepID=A0ABV9VZF6_9ACTN
MSVDDQPYSTGGSSYQDDYSYSSSGTGGSSYQDDHAYSSAGSGGSSNHDDYTHSSSNTGGSSNYHDYTHIGGTSGSSNHDDQAHGGAGTGGASRPVDEAVQATGRGGPDASETWHISARYDPTTTHVGHGWVMIEAPDGHRADVGYYPQTGAGTLATVTGTGGQIHEQDLTHAREASHGFTYEVSRDQALAAMEVLKGYEESSNRFSTFDTFGHNCVAVAAEVMGAAGIAIPAHFGPGITADDLLDTPAGAAANQAYHSSGAAGLPGPGVETTLDDLLNHARGGL